VQCSMTEAAESRFTRYPDEHKQKSGKMTAIASIRTGSSAPDSQASEPTGAQNSYSELNIVC
jgi:hypothetical protein